MSHQDPSNRRHGREAIHDTGLDAHGEEVSNGFYAVHPQGHLVLVKELKPGFRIASDEDIAAVEKAEADRVAAEVPPASPTPVEEPVTEVPAIAGSSEPQS